MAARRSAGPKTPTNDAMTMARLIDAVERRPQAAFAGFLVVHGLVWTALPSLLYFNLPVDVIEALVYGREWQLGYDKLPPLPWWLIEAAYQLFGTDVAIYALGQIAVIVAFVAVWLTARPLIGATGALAAILIIDGMHYFNFSAAKFNHNVSELPFWALAGFAFYAGLRHGRLRHWVLLGLALGLAWWAKYFMVILAAPLALFLLLDRDARRRLAGPGPWIAAAVALIVMAPHLIWLVQNHFAAFSYAEARAAPPRGALDHLLNPALYVVGQAYFLIPALLIAAPLLWPPSKTPPRTDADAFDRRIVTLLAFGPAATLFAFSLLTGRATSAMWGFPLWLFLGLWIVLFAPAALDRLRLLRIGVLWASRVRDLCRRVSRRLSGAAAARSSLARGVVSRRRVVRRDHAAVRGRRPGTSRNTSSARRGTAAMWRTIPLRARSRGC